MDLIQLSNTIGEEAVQKIIEASLIPFIAFGFAALAVIYAKVRTLAFRHLL